MNKHYFFLFALLLILGYNAVNAQETVNGGFELSDQKGMPRNWISDDAMGKFTISLSNKVFRSGLWSMQIDGSKSGSNEKNTGIAANKFGSISLTKLNTIQISGWLKSNEKIDSNVSLFIQSLSGAKIIRAHTQGISKNGWSKFTLNYSPSAKEDWYGFYYGVEVKSNRNVWIDDVSVRVNGVTIYDPKSLYQEPDPKSLKWLSANLSVLNSIDTTKSSDDLWPLGEVIKDARIVGIGEPTHGTSEAAKFKIRFLDYLVNKKGFNTIALEESIPTCDQMNRLLNLPSADLKDSLLSMPFYKLWKTEEMLGLFRWIYNYNLSHKLKVRFIGVDMEDIRIKNSRNSLRAYGRLHNAEILAKTISIDKNLDDLLKLSMNGMGDKKTLDAADRLKQQIVSLDSIILEQGIKTGNADSLFQLRSYARVCRQWVESRFYAGNRDQYMAENISIFLDAHPQDKILLWAHNFHIANATIGGQKTMGAFLKEKFSNGYYPISITTSGGTYMAAADNSQKKWIAYPFEQAYRGTYEYILARVKPDNYFLNLLNVNLKSDSIWLDTPMRQLDLGYLHSNEDNYTYQGTLKQAFDGIVFLRHTSASRSLLTDLR